MPRPSSPVGTKAFTVRPYLLHHIAKVFYHSYNTTKPFRDLLYCLFILVCMFLCCCSCCYSTTHLLESDCFSAIVFFATQMSIFVFLPISNFLVGLTGLEPVTPRLSSACSNQLSYRPGFGSLSRNWWRHGDSNPGHPACKAGALPTELYPQLRFFLKKRP